MGRVIFLFDIGRINILILISDSPFSSNNRQDAIHVSITLLYDLQLPNMNGAIFGVAIVLECMDI